ncbi:alpha/beta hydrolase [Pseudonocardiaceae bacterium YIM PH 21723]|nr:alpha/beta hydrolase [Pseudonocardiaceae bacterium YIM PH 21723]
MKRAVIAAALLLLTTAPAAQAAPGWTPCGPGGGAECTTVTVPVDWSTVDGPSIDLTVSRRKATGDRLGVLFFAPGGPGTPAAEIIKGLRPEQVPELQKHFDLVGVTARGLDPLYPVRCPQVDGPAVEVPGSKQEFADYRQRVAAFGAACREMTGPLFDHVDSTSDTRDLEAVRKVLGAEKVSFYSLSYGTLLSQRYAELFPDRVERIALDSAMDHSIPDAWSYMVTEAVAAEQDFHRWADWCQATESCALHGQDVYALQRELQARADLKDNAGQPLRLDYLTELTGDSKTWPAMAVALKSLRDTGISTEKNLPHAVRGFKYAILCQDWNFAIRDYAELRAAVDRLHRIAPMTRLNSNVDDVLGCLGWPVTNTNPPHRLPEMPNVQARMFHSRYDMEAPYSWAQRISVQSGWPLVTYQGVQHGVYEVPGMGERIDRFLVTGNP